MHRYLDARELRADWVQEVLARWPLKSAILDAYVSKVMPRGSVLGGSARANDRARQLGAHQVMDIQEPGALGAAFLGGIAAGVLERPGRDGVPLWASA